MPALKRLSTTRQTESARKKLQTPGRSTPSKETQVPAKLEEPLPSKIVPGRPLPVLDSSQHLPLHQLQSIAESGVLAASLDRSRSRWLTDGLFEKYWTKPVKRKGQPPEPPGNPPKDSMQRLGSCRIIIDPHVFDATLFVIHDPSSAVKSLPKQTPTPTSWSTLTMSQSPVPTLQYRTGAKQTKIAPPISSNKAGATPSKAVPSDQQRGSGAILQAQPANAAPTPNTTFAGSTPLKVGQDPVIQMLATRASSDSSLKALMQVVASGSADKDQLAAFQGHIDDLSRIIKEQSAAKEPITQPQASASSFVPSPSAHVVQGFPTAASSSLPNKSFKSQPPLFSANPSYSSPTILPQQNKLAPNVPLKPDIIGVAIEFAIGNGDRYSFPKHCIMQYDGTPREAQFSFLVTRKGSELEGSDLNPNQEYFQPITIRVHAEMPRVLEALSKVIATPEEVRAQMEAVMSKAQKAEDLQLALQLPRDGERIGQEGFPSTTMSGKAKAANSSGVLVPHVYQKAIKEETNVFKELHCNYCFEEVPKPPQKLEGKTVCSSCLTLRKKELRSMPIPTRRVDLSRQAAAPLALML